MLYSQHNSASDFAHVQFSKIASEYPEKIFATMHNDDDQTYFYTYAEIEKKSNQLAHHLIAQGITKGIMVSVCLDRTPEYFLTMLAVIKAGGIFFPIDESDTNELDELTLNKILDANTKFIIHDKKTKALFEKNATPKMNLDTADISDLKCTPPDLHYLKTDQTMCYGTSATTSNISKIITTDHEAFTNLIEGFKSLNLPENLKIVVSSLFSFDASWVDFCTCVATTGTLHLTSKKNRFNYEFLNFIIEKYDIDYAVVLPEMMKNLKPKLALKILMSMGSSAQKEILERWLALHDIDFKLLIGYGLTETGGALSIREYKKGDDPLLIGEALPGMQMLIMKQTDSQFHFMKNIPDDLTMFPESFLIINRKDFYYIDKNHNKIKLDIKDDKRLTFQQILKKINPQNKKDVLKTQEEIEELFTNDICELPKNNTYVICEPHEKGEIFISGPGVAKDGYINKPDLNKQKFLYFNYNELNKSYHRLDEKSDHSTLFYASGDYGCTGTNPNNAHDIQFLGRKDGMVKHKSGLQIFLPPIEKTLCAYDKIKSVSATVDKDGRIIVFIAPNDKHVLDKPDEFLTSVNQFLAKNAYPITAKEFLKQKNDVIFSEKSIAKPFSANNLNHSNNELPLIGFPDRLYLVPELPLTANAKVDNKSLIAAITPTTTENMSYLPKLKLPRLLNTLPQEGSRQYSLQKLWAQSLDRPTKQIPLDTPFAFLGGTSQNYTNLLNDLENKFIFLNKTHRVHFHFKKVTEMNILQMEEILNKIELEEGKKKSKLNSNHQNIIKVSMFPASTKSNNQTSINKHSDSKITGERKIG